MSLPQKSLSPRKRVWAAVAVTAGVHVVLLLIISQDGLFHYVPPKQRMRVNTVSQRGQASRVRPNPNSPPTPGKSSPDLTPTLPRDDLARIPPPEEKVQGQVVSQGQPLDERPPTEPTKYLSEKDSRVLKETRARETSPFFKNVLNKVQREGKNEKREAKAQPPQPQEAPEGQSEPGKQGGGQAVAQAPEPTPTPSRQRQDALHLEMSADGTIRNRAAHDALKGGGQKLAMNRPLSGSTGPAPHPGDNPLSGLPGGKGKPLNLTLANPLDVLGPVAGGPMNDDLHNLAEGDGTFLNAKAFKYAGYMNRIKETISRIWSQDVQDAAQRRDPTGQTYLYKDRQTLVEFTLDTKGEVTNVRVATPSGVQFLDEVAANAFKKAERFPNPPPGMVGPTGTVTQTFGFTLWASSGGGVRITGAPGYQPGAPGQRGY